MAAASELQVPLLWPGVQESCSPPAMVHQAMPGMPSIRYNTASRSAEAIERTRRHRLGRPCTTAERAPHTCGAPRTAVCALLSALHTTNFCSAVRGINKDLLRTEWPNIVVLPPQPGMDYGRLVAEQKRIEDLIEQSAHETKAWAKAAQATADVAARCRARTEASYAIQRAYLPEIVRLSQTPQTPA